MTDQNYAAIERALQRAATAKPLLVALDFDGTLAPLVDVPDDARMTAKARAAVEALAAAPQTTVALVSGRGLANLRQVSEADPKWWLIGSHGVELEGPANGGVVQVPTADPVERQALWDDFVAIAKAFPGAWVETKPWGAALHTRSLPADIEEEIRHKARAAITPYGERVTTRLGHGIIESSLQSQHKGDGIEALRQHLHPEATLFIGDDLTDEDAQAVLGPGDVGIRCGPGESMATYFLADVDAVADFLASVATLRSE
ncbi:trehalose 6-phosphate phosphatase [Pontimonas salivibrio]|uniref:Trehalose 6-phosphate phosphatase n=1 Tax=Pontimonas salivibrio TaxID=1159327 RepID=A0A2L2BS56_9MICO|nr:trehalose-phosphatase [Pontimonas salivibrio]AVG24514.1 trehalose 6-phosphate phosphatase [Pontimonas salivibrio]